ncbi:MAG: Holliday junction branch migration protein RuvA [Pseudomonadota bacterium]
MIGRLSGTLHDAGDTVIVDVAGVGYEVFLSTADRAALPTGEPVTLVIETVVREDMIRLYGFRDAAGRDTFRLLQGVQGVGAKVALAVLSTLGVDGLLRAIADGDRTAIARAPGVGKRVAERIATELKGKAGPASPITAMATPAAPADNAVADALSALVNLGYDEASARAALAAVRDERPDGKTAELIRASLKRLAA